MSLGIREMKRKVRAYQEAAFRNKRRMGLASMADAHRMASAGYGREDLWHATGLPMARCREIVFGKREARS